MWRCAICAETFETIQQFQEHTKSHPKPFKCPKCSKTYGILFRLRRHSRAMHNLEINTFEFFECSYCGRKFTTKKHLKLHMIRKHFPPARSSFMCDVCGHDFKDLSSLHIHQLLHTNSPPDYVPVNR